MAVNKNKIVALAQRYTVKGQFEKAIAEYRKLLRTDPGDIRTWLKIGDLYTRMGARKEATETYIRVAEQYTHSGFHLKAIAVYKQVLNIDPTLVVIHQYLAASYLELGLTSEALIQLEQLADVYEKTARNDLLLEVLLQMGKIDPHNIATRLRVAELLSKENRIAEASKHFAGACEELKQQGRREDFLKVAERLLYHDPSRTDTALEVAEIYVDRGQFKEALAKLQVCFVKDRRNTDTLNLLAESFLGLQQPEKAVSVLTELAEVLEAQGDLTKRTQVLEKILSVDPSNETAQSALGRSSSPGVEPGGESLNHAVLGDDVDIIGESSSSGIDLLEDLTAAENMTPDESAEKANKLLGEVQVLLKYGFKERALEHLQKLLNVEPYNIDARETARDILLSMGRTEEALDQLFLLAEVFKETQPEGSIYYLHEVLKVDRTNRKAREMIRNLGGIMPEGLDDEAVLTLDDEPPLLEDDDSILLIDDDDLQQADELMEAEPQNAEWADWDVSSAPPPAAGRESILELTSDLAAPPENTTVEVVDYFDDDPLELDDEFDEIAIEDEGSDISSLEDEVEIEEEFYPQDIEEAPEATVESEPFSPDFPAVEPTPESGAPVLETPGSEPRRVPGPSSETPPPLAVPSPNLEQPPVQPKESNRSPDAPIAALPNIDDDLEEAAFFLEQELFDETRAALDELESAHPGDPRVAELRTRLAEAQGEPEPPVASAPLSSIPAADGNTEGSVQFKHVDLKENISDSDSATAWDLGLAYKEMMLFDDALQAFEIAARAPRRAALAKTMIGICLNGLGRVDEAVQTFREGLSLPELQESERMGLLYELGKTFQLEGNNADASICYTEIVDTDPNFADAAKRLTTVSGSSASRAEG